MQVAVWDDKRSGTDRRRSRWRGRRNAPKLQSHCTSSSYNNKSQGRRGISAEQAGGIIGFSSSPAVCVAYSPLPCARLHVCVCSVRLNMPADACSPLMVAGATDFVYRIHNQPADVHKFVIVVRLKKTREPVFCGQLDITNSKTNFGRTQAATQFSPIIYFTNYTLEGVKIGDVPRLWWEIVIMWWEFFFPHRLKPPL